MNKKGFTLIELIAVIVILALISLIVFPTVNSIIKNSKEKAYNVQIDEIINAAKNYLTDNPTCIPEMGSSTTFSGTCEGVKYNGDYTIAYVSIDVLLEKGYISTEDKLDGKEVILNPKNTKKALNGYVRVSYNNSNNRYEYDYTENISGENKEGAGIYLLNIGTDHTTLKANDGIYKSSEVNNYLQYNSKNYRILKAYENGDIKIVLANSNYFMEYESYTTLKEFNIGKNSTWCTGDINNPCSKNVQGQYGLLTLNDYINASNNKECSIDKLDECKENNYLKSFSGYLMNKESQNKAYIITESGEISSIDISSKLTIYPVMIINVNIEGGSGSESDPYIAS